MEKRIQEYLRSYAAGIEDPHKPVKVLVALSVAEPEADALDELRAIGLSIDELIHNKILGSIMPTALETLRSHRVVSEVELSQKLNLHAKK